VPSGRQQATGIPATQDGGVQVLPSLPGEPPWFMQSLADCMEQLPPGRQQASVGRGQLAAAHVLPGPLGVPFKAMQFAAV